MQWARRRPPLVVLGVCVGLAVASSAIPAAIAYDPWAWLVWGREIGLLELDTVGGPSWKPLPVLVTTLLTPFGSGAPTLWLVVARTGSLLAIVGVYRLATRFAGPCAGVTAAAVLILSPDPGPRFVRLFLEGHTALITAALAVWAIERHLAGRPTTALLLLTALALDRPEAWPFLLLYAVWLWRNDPDRRALVGVMLALVPILWFGGDWWGAGSPLHGADSARVVADDGSRFVDSIRRVGEMVVLPAWVAALIAVFDAWKRRERALVVIAVAALVWFVLVVVMSAGLGYAALSRFLLPGAAVVCVLAGVGAVWSFRAVARGRARAVVAVVVVAVMLPLVVLRADGIPAQITEVADRHRELEQLDVAIAAAGGAASLRGCGGIAVHNGGVARVAAAWKLDIPLGDLRRRLGRARGVEITDRRGVARRAARAGHDVTLLAREGAWRVYAVGCPEAARPPENFRLPLPYG